jgi:voltage-gated potassium channel Kch
MLRGLLTGLPVLVFCVVLQAIFVGFTLRWFVRYRADPRHHTHLATVFALTTVMVLMLVGNFLQMGAWAILFVLLGEFPNYSAAVYHSAVNFSTLGYGDVVMSPRWRLLGALEAANGILMFGVSTAAMTAAVIDVLKRDSAEGRDR